MPSDQQDKCVLSQQSGRGITLGEIYILTPFRNVNHYNIFYIYINIIESKYIYIYRFIIINMKNISQNDCTKGILIKEDTFALAVNQFTHVLPSAHLIVHVSSQSTPHISNFTNPILLELTNPILFIFFSFAVGRIRRDKPEMHIEWNNIIWRFKDVSQD